LSPEKERGVLDDTLKGGTRFVNNGKDYQGVSLLRFNGHTDPFRGSYKEKPLADLV